MPRPKKKKTSSKIIKSKSRRLTPEEKLAIANEPAEFTLAQLASKYSTSINTIMNYRKKGKAIAKSATLPAPAKRGRKPGPAAARTPSSSLDGIQFSIDAGYINFRIAKHHPLARKILDDLTN